VVDGDAGALSDELELREWREDERGFARGDPFGPAIPRAFVAAKRIEWRNLRRIARGVEAGRPRVEIEEGLVAP
jgi:vacuolar-type H+-ATPase subunit C/Vma6